MTAADAKAVGTLLVRNAGRVLTNGPLAVVEGPAAVVVRDGRVEAVVPDDRLAAMEELPELDAGGRCVIPGFVDAHTHLVFAGDRSAEFAARLEGRRYEAGGIMSTVGATRAASQEELVEGVVRRAAECLAGGTTTIEVKSGYGLETEAEVRSLEAVREADSITQADLIPTFLGAHLDLGGDYIEHLVEEMLPACAPLAESCDAFCDEGALSIDATRKVLCAAKEAGLVPRVHAEELAHTGGAVLAGELGCASADHLVHADAADARALASAGVVAVLLPATSFCLRSKYADARMFLEAGCTVALATDCNPGTSYTTSMAFVIAVACSQYGLTADEAVRAATLGGAQALRRSDIGALTPGSWADLVVLDADHWVDLAYRPGAPLVKSVVKRGRVVV